MRLRSSVYFIRTNQIIVITAHSNQLVDTDEDNDNDNDNERNKPVADHKEVIQTDFDFFVTWSELLTAGGHTVHAFYDAHDNTNNGAGTHKGRYQ